MGLILDELLKSVEKKELDTQLKEICDKIMEEETPNFKFPDEIIKGPNIFLSIEVLYKDKFIGHLCLEREMRETYVISYFQDKKRKHTIEVQENNVLKILKEFTNNLSYYRGE